MIKSVFICNENGTCIFERHYGKIEEVDSQVFSGFITALGSFALEAIGEDLQALRMAGNQQMVLRRHMVIPILGVIIADRRDNLKLLNNLLQEILIEFHHAFPQDPQNPQMKSITDKDPKFKNYLDGLIKGRVSDRTFWFLGPVLGLVLSVVFVYLIFVVFIGLAGNWFFTQFRTNLIIDLTDGMDATEFFNVQTTFMIGMGIFMFVILWTFLIPGFFSGILSGSRRKGLYGSFIITVGAFTLTIIFETVELVPNYDLNIFVIFTVMLPFVLLLNGTTGYLGGYIAERRRLWPLPHEELPEKIRESLNIFFDRLSGIPEEKEEATYEETYEEDV